MKQIDIFTTPIYEFKDTTDLAKIVLEDVVTYKIYGARGAVYSSTDKDLNFSYYNEALITWFTECVKQVKEIHYVPEIELVITECWGTKSDRFRSIRRHHHANSILSGLFYLTDHPEACTNFYQSNPWNWFGDVVNIIKPNKEIIMASVKPEVGKLVIFPSNLMHDTKPNLKQDRRVTIAFNAFVSGKFGNPTSFLNTSTKSVKDAYND